jgi:hypothetical protein
MPGQNNFKRTAQHTLQLDAESGVGINAYPGAPQQDLMTEDGKYLVSEFNQGYLYTENSNQLIAEDGDLLTTFDWPEPYPDGYNLITLPYEDEVGYSPQAMLRWSDDGGHTWSSEHWASMEPLGQYGYRTFWRRLGMTQKLRDRVYELSGTDPVKIAIIGAELIVSPTNA